MAMKYADRAFCSMNGARFADLQRATLRQRHNRKAVKSMTDDGFNKGFVQGNRDIEIDVTIAIQNKLARPKFESIDYETNDLSFSWICGADQFIVNGVFLDDNDDDAPGVGDEAKATFKFSGLTVRDTVGNSVLFDIALAA